MLTPNQLKNYDFQSVGRNAYKSTDVDAFMAEVYESYEQMFRENGEIVKKMSLLAEKLAEYKSDSDNIRNALLTAERMKDKIILEAQEKAKETLEETEEKVRTAIETVNEKTSLVWEKANNAAEKVLEDAKSQADEILKVAQENATELLSKAQKIYDEQMGTIQEESEREKLALENLKKESTNLRESLVQIYTKQLQMVEDIPSFEEYETEHNKEDLQADDQKPLSDFMSESFIEDSESQSADDSQVDEYFSYEQQENNTQEKTEINETINEYIDEEEDEDKYMEYAPLEYISDEAKGVDNSDRDSRDVENGQKLYPEKEEEYQEEIQEKNENENDEYIGGYDGDDSEESIADLRVNIEEFYSEDDEDVITLKNFFNESDNK
ncbi:MAG: DivIVA domain-containing protein [Acutalibacteraceae bacterium]